VSGLRPRAFPDRPQGQRPTGSHWGLPVLAHRASAHAQGLRLRGAGPPLACIAAARMAFPTLQRGRRPGGVISELNGWPVRTPADASPATLPPPVHGLGPRWLATPSVLGSFIPCSMPVYPGAFCNLLLGLWPYLGPLQAARPAQGLDKRTGRSAARRRGGHQCSTVVQLWNHCSRAGGWRACSGMPSLPTTGQGALGRWPFRS